MSISQEFLKASGLKDTEFEMVDSLTLRYTPDKKCSYDYNFLNNAMTVRSGNAVNVIPFSQLDKNSLSYLRSILKAIGGTPPRSPPGDEAFYDRTVITPEML